MASPRCRKALNGCDYISNYFVAIGKSECVEIIYKMFEGKSDNGDEISMQELENGLSILSVRNLKNLKGLMIHLYSSEDGFKIMTQKVSS